MSKKFSYQITENDGNWTAVLLRRVTAKKTHITKQQEGFATEAEAIDWAEKELKLLFENLSQRNIRRSK